MGVIGIDLGTTYSAAAVYIDGETEIIYLQEGHPTLPSVVGVDKRGKIAIGERAKRNQAANPQDTVIEVKRQMGKKDKIPLGQKEYTPQEISAMILKRIKELAEEELDEKITGVVISCPAYFRDPERNATKEAGQLAGLDVLQIVNEPTAAAFAYANSVAEMGQANDQKQLAMVYDLGGGTFDVTIIKMQGGNVEVIGTGGDPELGGGNFDDCIVDWMLEELEQENEAYIKSLNEAQLAVLKIRLKADAEDAKKILCGPPEREAYQFQVANIDKFKGKGVPFSGTLTMAEFEHRIEKMMQNSLQWLDVAMKKPKETFNYTEEDLTDILLVGGSTRVPYVRRLLEQRYPNVPLRGFESGINPDEIVARGAAIVAAQVNPDRDQFVPTHLTEVTGHTLNVAVFEWQENQEFLHPLILKDTVIPAEARHEFASAGHMTPISKIRIYQGEGREITPEVTMIGEFIIEIEPRTELTPLEIGLRIDSNGLLVAHAIDKLAQRQVKCEINYEDSVHLPPDELARRQAQLAQDMATRVGRTANPLDDPNQGAPMPATGWAKPQRPSQAAVPDGDDALATMNPLAATLREKAMTSFNQIPSERQMRVMQIVGELSAAAQAGDETKVAQLGIEINQLLQDVP